MSGIGENKKSLESAKKVFDEAPITEATLPLSDELPRDVMEYITNLLPRMAELGKNLESGEASATSTANRVKAGRGRLSEAGGTDVNSGPIHSAFNASGVIIQEVEAYEHKVGLMRTKIGAAIGLLELAQVVLREYEIAWDAASEHMLMVTEAELVVDESIEEALGSL